MAKCIVSFVLLASLAFNVVVSRVDLQDQEFVQDQDVPDQADDQVPHLVELFLGCAGYVLWTTSLAKPLTLSL